MGGDGKIWKPSPILPDWAWYISRFTIPPLERVIQREDAINLVIKSYPSSLILYYILAQARIV